MSATNIVRLKASWQQEWVAWSKRSLTGKRYVYVWADGIHCNVRLEDPGNDKQCILVLMGAGEDGKKELIAMTDGYRESAQSWRELLLNVNNRGLSQAAKLATGDGALGFWAALREVYPATREQRCWVHKTANVLNKMPKSIQPKAKSILHDIWMAETRKRALQAFDLFVTTFKAKYSKAVECLAKDREDHCMKTETRHIFPKIFCTHPACPISVQQIASPILSQKRGFSRYWPSIR